MLELAYGMIPKPIETLFDQKINRIQRNGFIRGKKKIVSTWGWLFEIHRRVLDN